MSANDLYNRLIEKYDGGTAAKSQPQQAQGTSGHDQMYQALMTKYTTGENRDYLKRTSYINDFLDRSDSFFRIAGRETSGENKFNAADFFEERKKQADSLKKQASIVSQYLTEYGDDFTQEGQDYLRDYLSNFNTSVDEVLTLYQTSVDAKSGMRAYEDELIAYQDALEKKSQIIPAMLNPDNPAAYFIGNAFKQMLQSDDKSYRAVNDQWTDAQRYQLGALYNQDPIEAMKYARNVNKGQDPYQVSAANEQEEMELLALDLNAAKRELEQLEREYWSYSYDSSTPMGERAGQQELRRMEQEIDQKQQIINRAQLIQDRKRLGAVGGNDDFAAMSVYQEGITDSVYQYVNDVAGVRAFMDRAHNPAIKGAYDQMTADEVAIYNYHYATGGKEQAQRYLDTITETLNERKAGQMYQKVKGKTWQEMLFAAGVGLNQAAEGFQNNFSNADYIAPSAYQIAGGMVREELAGTGMQLPEFLGGGSMGQVGYDLINTAANMAPSMAIGALNPVAGTLVMGASAAGNAYQEALNEGYTKKQARTYSALVGASEAGLEYLMGGISSLGGLIPGGIVEKMLDGVDNAFKRFAIEMGGSMIGEGFEEGLQEVITPWIKNLTLMTDEQVNWNDVAYSTLLGALSGGVMEAPGTAINAATYSLRNRPSTGSSSSDSAPSTPALTERDIHSKVAQDGKDRIISSNESVDALDFDSIANGEATIQLSDGRTAPMDDMNWADQNKAARFMVVRSLPGIETEAANDLYHAMTDNNSGSDIDTVVGIRDAYSLGYNGFDKTDASRYGRDSAKLSPALRTAAFEAGRKQMEADAAAAPKLSQTSVNKIQGKSVKPADGYKKVVFEGKVKLKNNPKAKAEVRFMDYIAEKFSGTTVHVYQSYKGKDGKYYYRDVYGNRKEAPNGKYVGDEIWIDLNSGDTGEGLVLNTFAHEMYHHVEKWNKKGAQKLAGFVVKELGLKDVESAVDAQIKKAEAAGYGVEYWKKHGNNGKGMTREQAINMVQQRAMSDFVADSLETMFSRGDAAETITRLKEEDRGLCDKIKEFIDEWVSTLKQWYSDKTISEEGKMVAQLERFEELQKLFLEAVEGAGANYNAAMGTDETLTPGKESVIVNKNGDPVAMSTNDGTMMLSIRTYEEEGRSLFRKYLDKCVTSKRLTREDADEMRNSIEEIYNICKEFKDKYAPFSKWSDAEVIRDTHGKPVFSVVTPNGEYKMNLDFSLVCRKRRTLDAVFNEMTKRGIIDDFELGQKTVVKINEIIRKFQFETACSLCFVDARRFRQADVADSFVNLYNDLVQSLVPENRQAEISRFNFGGVQGIESGDGITKIPNDQLDFSHINDVLKRYESGTVEYKAAKYIKANPNGRKLLMRGDFMSSKGFDAVKSQNEDIMKLYNSKKGTGGPKAAFGDVQYLNEVIKKARWWTPKKAYEVGGVRIQSFSDYVPRMVFDYVQMIHDLAANKLPAHAYTKEALFVQQFGMTGVKINMSLIPAIAEGGIAAGLDKNGNYVWAGESFNFETAKAIQNASEYTENCGTICVGVSYQHIVKLLGDPNIRMVIPYHKSGLNPIVAHMNKIAEFTDYSTLKTNPGGCQSTMDSNGQKVENDFNFNEDLRKTGDPRKTAQNYLAWCHDPKHNYTPKFAEFEWHENYYKLLVDFTVYDKDGNYVPQRGVKAVFPKDGNTFGSMKDLIRSGLEEDSEIEGRRNRDLPKIVDEILKVIPRTEAEISETAVDQADSDLEAMNSLRNAPEDIHTVRKGLADTFDELVKTNPNMKRYADEYRQKAAEVQVAEGNLKTVRQQIQELSKSRNPKDQKQLKTLRAEAISLHNRVNNLNKRLLRIEGYKLFSDAAKDASKSYKNAMLQQMKNQYAEGIQEQLLTDRVIREELTGMDSDITIMEKEFIRIVKKYEQLEEKAGANAANKSKTISKLRKALKEEAASHDKDSKIWEREYNRLLREYEASGQKIERMERSISRRKETAKQQIERKKVEEKAKALMKMLTYPTKDAHVPMELQQPLQKFLDSIDFTSPRQLGGGAATIKDIAYTRALLELRSAIASQRTAVESSDDDGVFTLDVPPDFLEEIDKHIKTINDATNGLDLTTNRVYEMSSDELKDLSYILKIVNKAVREIDRLHMQGEKARTSTLAKDTMQEMNRRPATKSEKGNWFMWNNYTPYQAFRRYGKAAQKIFAGLTDGQAKLARTIDSTLKFTKDTYTAEEVRNWERTRHTIKLDSGKTVTMTPAQIMSFWCLSHRNHAIPHMQGAGIRISTLERILDGTKVQKEVVQREHYTLTVEDVNRINDMLTNRQKDVARKLQQYMQRVGGRLINEVSMARWDFMAATETDYFPIQTEDSGRDVKNPDQNKTSLFALLNKSFTKAPMKNAKNAMVIGSIFDVFANHMSETAEYNAFALPLIDALKWFNYRERIDIGEGHIKDIGVHKAIKDTLGTEATRYFVDLMTDINSSQKAGRHEDFFGKILGRSKAASVGWNIRVAIQQPSAIFRASMVLKPGSLVRGTIKKGTVAEMQKYSGIALWKSMGYYDLNVARSVEDQIKGDTSFADKFSDMGMWLPGKMDEWTWGWIWESTKNQVRAETKLSGEELLRATAKKFDDVVYQTQVADSVLTRSSFMRSKSQMVKEATSFMAEPTLSLNVLMSAFQDYEEGHTSWEKAKRGMMIGFTGYVLSGLANALLSSIVDAGRDDDEWETFLEKYGQALLGERFWDGNLFNEMNPLNKIIFVKDILSAITGYENQSSYGKAISGLIDLVNAVRDGMTGKTSKTTYGIIYQGLQYLSTVSGIGLSNMTREVASLWNNTFGKLYPDMRLVRYKPNNGEDLLLAIQKGDESDFERIAGRFEDQKAAESALKTAVGTHYKDGSMTAEEATEILLNYTGMEEDDVYWKLEEWNFAKKNGTSEGYGKFDILYNAIDSGEGIEAEIDRMREHGTESATIKSQISKTYRKQYLEADESQRAQIAEKVRPALIYAGATNADVDGKINDWNFEAEYGMTYDDMIAEYKVGEVTKSQMKDAMKIYGKKNFEIQEKIDEWDKDIVFESKYGMSLSEMYEQYDDGNISRNEMTNALVYWGKTKTDAQQIIRERDIENRLGIDYEKLDDAYKHDDISRQTFYNAMIEHGADREEADEAIIGYDWLKKNRQYDLTITDAKRFTIRISDKDTSHTLADYGIPVEVYMTYKEKAAQCKGVDANGDGKIDNNSRAKQLFAMIDTLPISNDQKTALGLVTNAKSTIRKYAPWR